jgi:adenosine/AMP kinase
MLQHANCVSGRHGFVTTIKDMRAALQGRSLFLRYDLTFEPLVTVK